VVSNVAPTTTMISDEALMLEFQGGSHPAFEQLFARYRGPLYGFFRRRLQGDQRAEDLTQETFVAVIRASARYEPRALVRTYLYSIAMNLSAAERRKQFRDSFACRITTSRSCCSARSKAFRAIAFSVPDHFSSRIGG